jgi:soluble lytic murein transglycosylase-like protein
VVAVCALIAGFSLVSASDAAGVSGPSDGRNASAAPTASSAKPTTPPTVLSVADSARYVAIFGLQQEENWKAADAEIAGLTDRTLIGTLLAQRYLSPHYPTSVDEARDWLNVYAGLPDARAIWELAHRKTLGKAIPQPTAAPSNDALAGGSGFPHLPPEPGQFNLRQPPQFAAGLQAWRAQHWAEAGKAFEAVASAGGTSSWYVAAAAFWAARAHLAQHQPESVDHWFEIAARQPRTFYGMLARATLGLPPDAELGPHPLSSNQIAELEALPAGRRALGLVQVGETDRAEAELRAMSVTGNSRLADAIVGLADLANMPTLCLALGNRTTNEAARYPVPKWQPANGFVVDRALMFALMMEESRFNTNIRSGSGASGLMQLMPATARSVAHTAGIPLRNVSDLVDPALNLSLGQEYVRELIGHQQVNGNLILLLAAYNTGPGPLAKWQSSVAQEDPLLFIENLSSQETRLYVERVMTNLWIYRQRLGQAQPDLDALAANRWPTYVSLEASTQGPVQHASAR